MSDSHNSPTITTLIRMFYFVGVVLVVGTLITVLIDVMFETTLLTASVIGLSIAVVKSSFVVAIFMHYKWDKKLIMITWTMVLTFIFFAGMMGLIMWADGDAPHLSRTEVPLFWVVAAALLGLALPASFTVLTVKLLSEPAPVEAVVPKPKRVSKKKKS